NAPYQQRIIDTLESHLGNSELLDEHIHWALEKQQQQLPISVQEDLSNIASHQPVNKTESKKKRLIRIVEKGLPRDA
ncbi:tRNA epoxyqueuosine(34) reductase QueG, partial [Vibrio sp. D173a]|nr:tRNA epoxyqueuosine(34) reductase QueG [Vibrio sp. D173a]